MKMITGSEPLLHRQRLVCLVYAEQTRGPKYRLHLPIKLGHGTHACLIERIKRITAETYRALAIQPLAMPADVNQNF